MAVRVGGAETEVSPHTRYQRKKRIHHCHFVPVKQAAACSQEPVQRSLCEWTHPLHKTSTPIKKMRQFHSFLSGLERTDAWTKLGWSEVMRWKQRLPVRLSPVVLCHTYCVSTITDHHVYKPFQNERSWETQWAVHRLHGAARLCQTPHGWSVSVCLILFHAVVSATQRTRFSDACRPSPRYFCPKLQVKFKRDNIAKYANKTPFLV